MEEKKQKAYRIGVFVFVLLAVLTLGEFWLARTGAPWWAIFWLIALNKAWFVMEHYMHLPKVFAGGEGHEH